ncbi:MAG: hypothetical protein PHI18_10320 [bacterium]|nr:hypothetical protein [bacterium]
MKETFEKILLDLAQPHHLDLDGLRETIETLAAEAELDRDMLQLYELELQRELRAKVDLAGAVSGCAAPEIAFTLRGPVLITARREAARQFNRVFHMAPLCRKPRDS